MKDVGVHCILFFTLFLSQQSLQATETALVMKIKVENTIYKNTCRGCHSRGKSLTSYVSESQKSLVHA